MIAATPAAVTPQAPPTGRGPAVELRRWTEQGFDAEAARSWTSVGIGPAEAREWRQAGIEFAEWANQWKGEGFSAAEAGLWVREVNVYTAGQFRTAGFSVAEARAWIDQGVRSALRAKEFRDRGFTPVAAGEWWRLEFFPDDAAAWRDEGLSARDALTWKYGERESAYTSGGSKVSWRSVYSVEWVRQWKTAGFSAAEARLANDYNVSFAEATQWLKAGFGFEEAVAWKDSGFGSSEAATLKAAGLNSVEAEARNGVNPELDVITMFHSDITVRPDAGIDVTETILVANGPVGPVERCFARTFPSMVALRRSRSSSDPGWPSYRLLSVLHDGVPAPYVVERNRSDDITVCIGGQDALLSERAHTFTLRYTTGDRLIERHDHDRFFFDVTAPDLEIPIRRASATVHLPRGADTVRADGFAGPRDRKYFVADVKETADGDEIVYTVTRPLKAGMAFAVALDFRKGFVRQSLWRKARHLDREMGRIFSSLAVFAGGLAAAVVYFILAWYRVGRDPKRGVIVPAYEPPGGMSPALMRYLVAGRRVDDKTVAATLVRLAQCGAVVIREREGRYRLSRTKTPTQGCHPHEAEFFEALFAGTREIALGTGDAKRRLGAARRVLRKALRGESARDVATNRRYLWPGLALSLAGAVGALAFVDSARFEGAAVYAGFMAVGVSVVNLAFRALLKAPTPHARRLRDGIEGFRRFLEASFKGPAVVHDRLERDLPPAVAANLPYAIAFGIDTDRVSILDRRVEWYAGQSGGFSAADFTGAFARMTPEAVKA